MSKSQIKTLIAVPNMGDWKAEFGHSIFHLKRAGEMALQQEMGSLIYEARNKLAQTAMDSGADYVLWFDADMIFPPETFLKLYEDIQKPGVDMVTGLYFRRIPPYSPVLFEKVDVSDEGRTVDWAEPKEVPAEMFEIAGAGFGCLLMKAEVIKATLAATSQLFTPFATVGEDLSFCWRARQAGFHIWCDPTVTCGHVGKQICGLDLFLAYQQALEAAKK